MGVTRKYLQNQPSVVGDFVRLCMLEGVAQTCARWDALKGNDHRIWRMACTSKEKIVTS